MSQNTPRICACCNKQPAMQTSSVCMICYSKISNEMADTVKEDRPDDERLPIPRRS